MSWSGCWRESDSSRCSSSGARPSHGWASPSKRWVRRIRSGGFERFAIFSGSWYIALAVLTLLLVGTLAAYGFIVAVAGRPAFGGDVGVGAQPGPGRPRTAT